MMKRLWIMFCIRFPAEERTALDSEMESVIKDINEDISNDRTTTEPPEQPHVDLTGSCINPHSDDNEEKHRCLPERCTIHSR